MERVCGQPVRRKGQVLQVLQALQALQVLQRIERAGSSVGRGKTLGRGGRGGCGGGEMRGRKASMPQETRKTKRGGMEAVRSWQREV
jgi:hypothetical protein